MNSHDKKKTNYTHCVVIAKTLIQTNRVLLFVRRRRRRPNERRKLRIRVATWVRIERMPHRRLPEWSESSSYFSMGHSRREWTANETKRTSVMTTRWRYEWWQWWKMITHSQSEKSVHHQLRWENTIGLSHATEICIIGCVGVCVLSSSSLPEKKTATTKAFRNWQLCVCVCVEVGLSVCEVEGKWKQMLAVQKQHRCECFAQALIFLFALFKQCEYFKPIFHHQNQRYYIRTLRCDDTAYTWKMLETKVIFVHILYARAIPLRTHISFVISNCKCTVFSGSGSCFFFPRYRSHSLAMVFERPRRHKS